MKNARTLHHEAMNKLHEAESALEKGYYSSHMALLTEASSLETEAAYLLRDKFEAEPTRSVLFRSAATLALRCREFRKTERIVLTALTGNVPAEIRSELLDIFSEALAGNSPTLPIVAEMYGGQEYINALRKQSLNFKVVSKGAANAVRMDHAISAMRNIRLSYSNFSSANYRHEVAKTKFSDKDAKIMKQAASEELLITDLRHKSFGFSIAVDTFLMKGLTYEISQWKEKTFINFEQEVINMDYSSIDIANKTASRYTNEELRGVYGPIVSMLQESSGYEVAITTSDFKEIKRVLTPVKKAVSSIVVPKYIPTEKDLKLFQAFGMAEPGDTIQKDNILGMEEVSYMEFNRSFSTLKYGKSTLFFKEEYSVKIEYNSGVFSVDSADFGFRVVSGNHKDIFDKYSEKLIELYVSTIRADFDGLTPDEVEIRDKFENLVSMASIE